MPEHRSAVVHVDPEVVWDLMGFPKEPRPRFWFYDFDTNTFKFSIEDPSFPVKKDGERKPTAKAIFEDGKFVRWEIVETEYSRGLAHGRKGWSPV